MFSLTHIVVIVVISALVAALLLTILLPTARSGPRLLRNWGVREPTREQGRIVHDYLRRRAVLYVVFLVLAGPFAWNQRLPFGFVGCFLAGLLLAELIAMVRPVRGRIRVATLTRRGIRDVLPTWMIAVHLTAATLAVGVLVVAADRSVRWIPLAAAVGSGIAVYAAVWFAVARPAIGDPEVDAALRSRSARVATGLGTLFAANLGASALNVVGSPAAAVVAQVLGLVAWGLMVSVPAFRAGLTSGVRHG